MGWVGEIATATMLSCAHALSSGLAHTCAAPCSFPSPSPLTPCSPDGCRDALRLIRQRSQSLLQGVTLSTDAYGSLPVFDAAGRLVRYDVAEPGALVGSGWTPGRRAGWWLARCK